MGWLRQESFFSEWQGVTITKSPSKCLWSKDRALLKRATVVLFSAIRHQNTHHNEWCNERHDLPRWKVPYTLPPSDCTLTLEHRGTGNGGAR